MTFLTGYTQSLDYPTIPGTAIVLGFTNVIVTALDEESGFPVWSTVLSGDSVNEGWGIAMLPNGNVVVVGRTYSVDFPTTPGVQDTTVSESGSSFIAELEAQTGRFVWCTLLDYGWALSVAAASDGAVVLAGIVSSPYLPTTVGTFQPTHRGGYFDGFVARISNQGRALDWCTYLGSSDEDDVRAVGLDDQGRPVVGGFTGLDFPVTPGSYDTHCDGLGAGFVTKLTADGRQLSWSTFLEGADISALKIGRDGRVVVAGGTGSETFPVTIGAYQTSMRGTGDGFISTLSVDGSSLLQSTYLGGPKRDELEGLSLPPGGGILVCGRTWGPTFPGPLGPDQFAVPGINAAVLAHLNSSGQALLGSGVYGGNDFQQNDHLAATCTGAAILVGSTWSTDFPVTEGCYDDSLGGEDIFAMRVESLVTPVWLRSFEARRTSTSAVVQWRWEGSVAGGEMRLWRQTAEADREPVAQWDGGVTLAGDYADVDAPDGELSYWLQLLAENGQESWYGPAWLAAKALPERFALAAGAPNPFNPKTTIRYSLPQPTRVTLAIYDQRGRLLRTLVDAAQSAGEQSVDWDGQDSRGRSCLQEPTSSDWRRSRACERAR